MSDSVSSRPSFRQSRLWRWSRNLAIGFFGLIALLMAVCLFENWRGARAWERLQAEMQAKGEKLDYRDFIPAKVPDADNFAATPLLVPLLDYAGNVPGNDKWRDPEGKQRIDALSGAFSNSRDKKSPPLGVWQIGQPVLLEDWQEYFVGHTNYPGVTRGADAAQTVLAALRRFDGELTELQSASARPHSVFPVRYEENFYALLPHLATFKGISSVVRLRALARLQAGQKDEAVQDVRLTIRLAESVAAEPFIISQLVRIAILQTAVQPVWEGCVRHAWTDAQLAELQTALAQIKLLADYGRSMRGERAFNNAAMDLMRTGKYRLSELVGDGSSPASSIVDGGRLLVSGWIRQNQIVINRLHQDRTIPLVDADKHRVFVPLAREAEDMPELREKTLYNIFAKLLMPAVTKLANKFANCQASLDLARIACALERHRLAHGEYPAQLDPLVPRFIEKIPTDVITGELLKYRREADGTFALWSVGWNERDDQGAVGLAKSGKSQDPLTGDWVWSGNPAR